MQQLNYKNEVIIPTLLAYGSWTLNDQVRYLNTNFFGIFKITYNTKGNYQIIDFPTIEAMADDIYTNIFN